MSSRSKRSNTRKGKKRDGPLQVLHQDMKSLLELQRAQETKFVPETPDVPRIRFSQKQIVNVELSYQISTSLSTTAPTFGALPFTLANGDNYSNYVGCFDQYRIIQVNVKYYSSPLAAGMAALMYTVIDYDDANTLSAPGSYLGYDTLKVAPVGIIDERTLNPRIAVAAYNGSVFSAFANMSKSTWLDTASGTVQYYGLKYYVPTLSVANTLFFVVTMMVQFKSQKSIS